MSNLNNEYLPDCPTDCDNITLPTFSEACFGEATIEESEIQEIFWSEPHSTNFGEPKNPITGWTDVGLAANATVNEAGILTWMAGKDQDGSGTLKSIKVIGNKPAPTTTDATGPEGKIVRVSKKHTLLWDVVTLDNLTYQALQKLDACSGAELHFWYRSKQYIYGGKYGIKGSVLGVPTIMDRGVGAISRREGAVEWMAKIDPPRDAWPTESAGS